MDTKYEREFVWAGEVVPIRRFGEDGDTAIPAALYRLAQQLERVHSGGKLFELSSSDAHFLTEGLQRRSTELGAGALDELTPFGLVHLIADVIAWRFVFDGAFYGKRWWDRLAFEVR